MADYKIEEIDGKLHVCVTTPPIPKRGPHQREKVYTPHVLKYLTENNIKFGRMLKNDTAHNIFGDGKGYWIFEIPLDKSPEPVILKVEKSVQPKPKPKATRKKRTRSSTKKVSTEE